MQNVSNLFLLQIEITRETGDQNIFLFGTLAEDVEDLRHAHFYRKCEIHPGLKKVFDAIQSGKFGDQATFSAVIAAVTEHGDYYLVSDDFQSYLDTHDLIDVAYKNQDEWVSKCITSVARMGFFSSDRCIQEYADSIWNIEPLAIKNGA
jgi:starch phosphorylase